MTDIRELIHLIKILFPNLEFSIVRHDKHSEEWVLGEHMDNFRLYREDGGYMRPLYPVNPHFTLKQNVSLVIEHMRYMNNMCISVKRKCKDGYRYLTEKDFPKKKAGFFINQLVD